MVVATANTTRWGLDWAGDTNMVSSSCMAIGFAYGQEKKKLHDNTDEEIRKKNSPEASALGLEPNAGLEPAALRLRVSRSTD